MESWLQESLSNLLNFPVPEDMINYVLSIEYSKEMEQYLKTLLNFEDMKHKTFLEDFMKKRFGQGPGRQKKKKISKNKENNADIVTKADNAQSEGAERSQNETNTSNKKKSKFVNLYSQDGQNAQVVFLKGRHRCECQAAKHGLINNCMTCGRIVCKQEGSGPCLFCGHLVCTPEEQKEVNSNSKSGAKLMENLMEKKRPKGWEAALAHRNRLLEYDRTSERRTHVTDDDSDYFSSNSVWLTSEERDKLQQYQKTVQEKRHGSRLNKKITFDFGGRRIIEEDADLEVDENKINEIMNSERTSAGDGKMNNFYNGESADRDVAPGVNAPLLTFDPSVPSSVSMKPRIPPSPYCRIQDVEIQEVVDMGKCLSMHQPWASLLVEGIKMHEGRTWYTAHRGRLWIASTAKPPDTDTVRALEATYRALHHNKELVFPTFYPTGCLLGCVNVDDCLPQEEYEKIYPGGESDSPYVFVCSNPVSLRVRFPVKGQHKIYSLDKAIHKAAVKFMLKSAKQSADI